MKSTLLEPSENPTFNFPPLPRRPLRSETYRTLVRIMSHCTALESSRQLPKQSEEEAAQPVARGEDHMESVSQECEFPQVSLVGNVGGDAHETLEDDVCSNLMDAVIKANQKVGDGTCLNPVDSFKVNIAHINSVLDMVDNKKGSCDVGHEDVLQQKVDKMRILPDFEAPVGSSLHTDIAVEGSTPVHMGNKTNFTAERNLEVELQMKDTELEKLLYNSAAMDSSLCLAVADDVEEGEISGDEVPYETMDFLFDEAVSLEEVKMKDGQELEKRNGEIGFCENDMSNFLSVDEVHNSNYMPEFLSNRTHLDANNELHPLGEKIAIVTANNPDTAIQIGHVLEQHGDVKFTDNLASVTKDFAPRGINISKNPTGDVVTDEKEVSVDKKEKKRRGPLTKERKAKKKQKERIKRAEKNRRLGVKRLKLQPLLKPKKVTFCRHYLKGRCQEGEKCKFSHDTTPLTKSMPCCHFARHSCMKGDNCPYDHQLSKYPCNNYVANGFCSRGADCLFSHEISANGGSLTTPNNCKAEQNSLLRNSSSNSKTDTNVRGILQQRFDANSNSVGNVTGRSSEKMSQRPAAVPKGISVISLVGSPSGSKLDRSPMPVKGDLVNLDQEQHSNPPNRFQKSDEVVNRMPPRPKGINFLSFGRAPLDASQINGNHEVGESWLGELNRSSIVGVPSSSNKVLGSESSQNSLATEPNKNEATNLTSIEYTPQGVKFFSFGKVSDSNCSTQGVGQSGLTPDNVNKDLSCSHGKEETLGGPKFSSDKPLELPCSSNPFSLSSNKSSNGNLAGMSNSLKESLLMNTPKSALKALNSTLAFAAKFESQIKLDPSTSAVRSRITTQNGSNFGK